MTWLIRGLIYLWHFRWKFWRIYVGLYDSLKRFNDNGICYISEKDIVEIVDNEKNATNKNNSMLNSGISVLYAVVDDKENINDVKK